MDDADAGRLLTLAREEIAALRQVAWECARLSGADLSGLDGPEHLAFDPREAIASVCSMREEQDEDGCATACRLIQRIPFHSIEETVSEASPLDKAKMIAEAGLDCDLALLKRFGEALPPKAEEPA